MQREGNIGAQNWGLATDAESEQLITTVADEIIADFCVEYCFDFHWQYRTGRIGIEELFGPPAGLRESKNSGDVLSKRTSRALTLVHCPSCKDMVSSHRFAPHLERCMQNNGKWKSSGHSGVRKINKPTSLSISSKHHANGAVKETRQVDSSAVNSQKQVQGEQKRNHEHTHPRSHKRRRPEADAIVNVITDDMYAEIADSACPIIRIRLDSNGGTAFRIDDHFFC